MNKLIKYLTIITACVITIILFYGYFNFEKHLSDIEKIHLLESNKDLIIDIQQLETIKNYVLYSNVLEKERVGKGLPIDKSIQYIDSTIISLKNIIEENKLKLND